VLETLTTSGLAGPRDSIVIQYDSAGRWDSHTTTYDNDPVRSTVVAYDDAGRIDSRTETASNGFVTTASFNDSNQRTSVVSDDTASNAHGWTSSTLTLDPATGRVLLKETLLDNGNTVAESFNAAGQFLSRVTTDANGDEAFATATQIYAGGVYSHFNNVYDNNTASAADDTGLLIGTSGVNVFTQNNGIADLLIGNGGNDVFVFAAGMGADRIADFAASDLLDLTAFGVDTRAELEAIATITQVGANLLIDFADADSLTLNNFLDANLDNGDFMTNV